VLFRFENSLRVFVYTVLKDQLKDKWQETAVSNGCIKSETKKRIKQSEEYGYLGHDTTCPMLFLNSGELIEIIVSDAYWKYFAKYFKSSKSIVITKLQEIGTVRNSLAHFRPLKEDDVE
ncbi:Swt1 family HEPN domain-containing protein, partial [Vibrio aestuarianus]|uniref:Swt1 family HEPN domain-containing protein n=1 Tax=Vibrio aestuarianus TaxID=28171 RepID=UPI0021C3ADF5